MSVVTVTVSSEGQAIDPTCQLLSMDIRRELNRQPTALLVYLDGDIAECYADASLAKKLLGWQAELSIERACADGWRWQQRNPDGYRR